LFNSPFENEAKLGESSLDIGPRGLARFVHDHDEWKRLAGLLARLSEVDVTAIECRPALDN